MEGPPVVVSRVGGDLAHPSAKESARVGDEGGDHELVRAGRHGAANLTDAVVGSAGDRETVDQELREPPAIDEAGIPATGDLVVMRVVLPLQPGDPIAKLGRHALAIEREAEGMV